MASLGRRPRLDGIRGAAIGAVVLYHAQAHVFPGGWIGVDIFFVLSGFLITTLLLEEFHAKNGLSFRSFYTRRALRLLPALAVFLVVCGVIASFHHGHQRTGTLRFIAVSAFYVANIAATKGVDMTFVHTWSLSEEEQFYVLWPVALLVGIGLLVRLRQRRTWIVVGTAVLMVASTLLGIALWRVGYPGYELYYSPATHCTPLLAGCLLAELRTWGLLPRVRAIAASSAVGIATIGLIGATFSLHPFSPVVWDGGLLLLSMATAVVVWGAVEISDSRSLDLLAWRPLTLLGLISYALYLWHPVILAYAGGPGIPRTLFAVVLSLGAATASYLLVERRFLRMKRRFQSDRPADHTRLSGVTPATEAAVPAGQSIRTTR